MDSNSNNKFNGILYIYYKEQSKPCCITSTMNSSPKK